MFLTYSYMIKYVNMHDNYGIVPFLINIITCILICSTCKLTFMLQVNMDKSHVNLNQIHVNKLLLHVDIIFLAIDLLYDEDRSLPPYQSLHVNVRCFFVTHGEPVGDRGSIPGRDRPKSLKQVVVSHLFNP